MWNAFRCILAAAFTLCVMGVIHDDVQNRPDSGTDPPPKKKLVCYYTNWSQYRPGVGQFRPKDIDPFLCTHIVFAFGWMRKNRPVAFDEADEDKDGQKGLYSRALELKKKNPELKVLLAIGGWSFGTQRFKDMASSRFNRQKFIYASIEFLRSRGFDGLDIDWEFPRGLDDKKNFALLLKEMRSSFEEEAKESAKSRLLLTAAVSAGAETVQLGYDVPEVVKYVDFLNVMSYDFHGKWENQTGHNSPLYPASSDSVWRKQLCVDYGVKLWEKLGAPKEKLVVGFPTYGRSFTLADPKVHGMNAPTIGGGDEGPYTRESGFLAHYEICELLKSDRKRTKYVWDEEQRVPYIHKDKLWVGFDDLRSFAEKVQWLLRSGYGGAMVWTIDMDDFRGNACGGRSYPLIRTIYEELRKPVESSDPPEMGTSPVTKRQTGMQAVGAASMAAAGSVKNETQFPQQSVENTVVIRSAGTNANVVCYYTNWSQRRPGIGKFVPEYIDPFLCTHVIFAFGGIRDGKIVPTSDLDTSEGKRKGLYERLLNLRKKNSALRVLISIGGWMIGSEPFETVTATSFRRTGFILNAIEFLREHTFDGLDVDWEFPRGPDQKVKFAELIQHLRTAFDDEAEATKKPRLLLSLAVPASFEAVAAGYDVPEISRHVDMMNVLTYDFHGDWEKVVGHNSPLFPLKSSSAYQKKLTVEYGALEWVRNGAAREKLNIGMATYGRTFTLANSSLNDVGAPAASGGTPGKYTKESGFLAFYEICDILKSGATLVWDDEQMVPYVFTDDQWIGFDDMRSIAEKTKWLRKHRFGGVMVWAVDMDDFRGNCIGKPFPLIMAARDALKNYTIQGRELQFTAKEDPSTSQLQNDEVVCDGDEGEISYHADLSDCFMYYMCEGKRRHHMPCPVHLVFNAARDVCDWPENVEDCQIKT